MAELEAERARVSTAYGSAAFAQGDAYDARWAEVRASVDALIAAARQPLIKQRDAMLARGFMQPCFLDNNHAERLIPADDKCAGATYQCFYCKEWWCETHAGGHFETEPAALAGVLKEAVCETCRLAIETNDVGEWRHTDAPAYVIADGLYLHEAKPLGVVEADAVVAQEAE